MKRTFTFIVDFRGGTYCLQVQADDVNSSLEVWLKKITEEKDQIQHLGDKTLKEIGGIIKDKDKQPVELRGLINAWFMYFTSRKGSFSLNMIQTDINKSRPL